jgi:phosphoribosyl-ATP pyrophosphohydrolase
VLDLDALDFDKGNGLVTVVAQDALSGAVLMLAHADREALARTLETGEMHYRSRTRGLWHKGATSGNVQRVVSLSADCDGDAVLARVAPAGPACHTGTVSCFGDLALGADAVGALDRTIAERGRPPRQQHGAADADSTDRSSAVGSGSVPGGPPDGSLPLGETSTGTARAPIGSDSRDARGASPRQQHDASLTPTPHHPDAEGIDVLPVKSSYTAKLLADRNLRLKKIGEEAAELVTACADGDAERAAEEGADVLYHTLVALRAVGVGLDDVRRVLEGRRR